ncbi:MAG: hypothetical protein M3536_09900, partial [Actinomycetota bacterium]|nr:hypothetical protein [Actinomycetota bacterium]
RPASTRRQEGAVKWVSATASAKQRKTPWSDLAGTSSPNQNLKVPEPTDPNRDVEVHSSISEGSNAMEAEREKAPVPRDVPGPAGLPEGDPESLRADPGEGDEDPSTDLGRS